MLERNCRFSFSAVILNGKHKEEKYLGQNAVQKRNYRTCFTTCQQNQSVAEKKLCLRLIAMIRTTLRLDADKYVHNHLKLDI